MSKRVVGITIACNCVEKSVWYYCCFAYFGLLIMSDDQSASQSQNAVAGERVKGGGDSLMYAIIIYYVTSHIIRCSATRLLKIVRHKHIY